MQPAWLTKEVFLKQIGALLANIPICAIRSQIGVSRWYANRIRQGFSRTQDTGRCWRSRLVFREANRPPSKRCRHDLYFDVDNRFPENQTLAL
jgi:hypothetical protein